MTLITALCRRVHAFFFAEIAAAGFGLMRMAWAATLLYIMLPQGQYLLSLYGTPPQASQLIFQHAYHVSLLFWMTSPSLTMLLYGLLLASTIAALLGLLPRLSVAASAVLFLSFYQRNIMPFHSDGTLVNIVGFLLVIAPCIDECSLWRFLRGGAFAEGKTMAVWPVRLLTWQLLLIYLTTAWYKALSVSWTDGSAIDGVFHGAYSRISIGWADLLRPFSPLLTSITLTWEFLWILLIVPARWLPVNARRALLLSGLLVHLSWAVLLQHIESLSFMMIAAYCGLLTGDDVQCLLRLAARVRKLAAWPKIALLPSVSRAS